MGNGHDAWVGYGMWLKISECTSAKSQGANKDIDYEGLGIREALCFDQTPRRKPGKQSSRLRGELSLFKDSQLYSHHVLWYSDQLISSRNDHTGAREGAHSQPPLNQGFSYFLALLWQHWGKYFHLKTRQLNPNKSVDLPCPSFWPAPLWNYLVSMELKWMMYLKLISHLRWVGTWGKFQLIKRKYQLTTSFWRLS